MYETKTKSDSKLTENDYFLRVSELGLPRLRSRDHLFAKGLLQSPSGSTFILFFFFFTYF